MLKQVLLSGESTQSKRKNFNKINLERNMFILFKFKI
jgi:hypothetical protein